MLPAVEMGNMLSRPLRYAAVAAAQGDHARDRGDPIMGTLRNLPVLPRATVLTGQTQRGKPMQYRDYSICPINPDGKHGPVHAYLDLEIASTHVAVICEACGVTTGYPIADIIDKLEWN